MYWKVTKCTKKCGRKMKRKRRLGISKHNLGKKH